MKNNKDINKMLDDFDGLNNHALRDQMENYSLGEHEISPLNTLQLKDINKDSNSSLDILIQHESSHVIQHQ